eukprot:scaffold14.g1201.t1
MRAITGQALAGTWVPPRRSARQIDPRVAPGRPGQCADKRPGAHALVALRAEAAAGPPASSRTSLVPESLDELDSDAELQELHARVRREGQAALTREEARRRQRSLDRLGVPPFDAGAGVAPLVRGPTAIFQLNIGLLCNQACRHCHVESSPRRTELMSREVAEQCVRLMAASPSVDTVDVTGGAPELAPQFRYLVAQARALGLDVIDRCNLTEDLVDFLAAHRVRVVASLPCYSAGNLLNAAGFGRPGTGLTLDLIYNPGGPFLAPPQAKLEPVYRQELGEAYGISFSSLLALNNLPVKRWADHLVREGKLEEYMQLLVESFNPAAAAGLMCRNTVSVRWDGSLYDCDFNQQLDLGLASAAHRTVFDVASLDDLTGGLSRKLLGTAIANADATAIGGGSAVADSQALATGLGTAIADSDATAIGHGALAQADAQAAALGGGLAVAQADAQAAALGGGAAIAQADASALASGNGLAVAHAAAQAFASGKTGAAAAFAQACAQAIASGGLSAASADALAWALAQPGFGTAVATALASASASSKGPLCTALAQASASALASGPSAAAFASAKASAGC